jgi:hypothetical protein
MRRIVDALTYALSAIVFVSVVAGGSFLCGDEADAFNRRPGDRRQPVNYFDAGIEADGGDAAADGGDAAVDAGLDAGYQNVQAASFDGVNESIGFGDPATGGASAVTLAIWFKTSAFGNDCVFCKYNSAIPELEWRINTGDGGDLIVSFASNITTWATWQRDDFLSTGAWHHVCVAYAFSDVNVWLNGVDITATGSESGSWPATVVDTSRQARTGRNANNSDVYFGLTDEPVIFIGAAPSCSDIYFGRVLRPLDGFSPAADHCWNFNAADNTTVPDSCGALTGTPANMEAGDFSGADMPP